MKNFLKKESFLWLFLALPFLFAAATWSSMPDVVPTHWNAHNQVDGYGSKTYAELFLPFLNMGLYLFFYGLFWLIPKIDPRKQNFEKMGDLLYKMRAAVTIFLTIVFLLCMNASLTANPGLISVGVGIMIMLLIAALGKFIGNVRPNYFVGIRTPWTLESPEVWTRTHQAGGRILFYTGLIGAPIVLAVSFIENGILPIATAIVLLMGSTIYIVYYSYKIFNQLEKKPSETYTSK